MARLSEHDPIAGRLAESGVGRTVLRSEIRLDLDDPPHPSPRRVVANEAGADEGAAGRQRRARQEGPIDDAQRNG